MKTASGSSRSGPSSRLEVSLERGAPERSGPNLDPRQETLTGGGKDD